jgi:hypothetical protein
MERHIELALFLADLDRQILEAKALVKAANDAKGEGVPSNR